MFLASIVKPVSVRYREWSGPSGAAPIACSSSRSRDVRFRGNVHTTVSLEQTLVSRRQEREPVEIVLVIDFDAFGKARRRVTRNDQADEHTVYIHLIAIRRSPASNTTAVGKHRIDGRVQGDDVTGEPVGDRDGPTQVNGLKDVEAGALERGHLAGREAEGGVDTERVGVAHQHREQDVRAEVGHVVEGTAVQITRLPLGAD